MLIAQKKYKRSLTMHRRLKKEKDITALNKIEKSNPKLFWNTVKKMINEHKEEAIPEISDEQWVNYFYNLFNRDVSAKPFNQYIDSSLEHIEKQSNKFNNILNDEITSEEIIKCLKSTKNGKSSGIDCITNEMLKSCINNERFIQCLKHLFNITLSNGMYPNEWTCSIISPIHKTGPKDDPQNYRGIAVSNCISKTFNKILTQRIDKYMNENQLWSNYQGGFKQGIRTEDNILILQTLITEMTQTKNGTLYTCFVDFSKFFDTINRNMLFYKLMKVGITGNIYRSIKNMYNKCNYAIKTNNSISKLIHSNMGVKQGCTLSPILSNIYQNDLHSIFDNLCDPVAMGNLDINSLSWADDLVLISSSQKGLQRCLDKLEEYCDKWGLSLNTRKTKIMTFGKCKKMQITKYKNTIIEKVDQYKYLGVIIHKSGKLKYAIEDRIAKANRAIGMVRSALSSSKNVSVNLALSIFDKQIFPILSYGSLFWYRNDNFTKLYLNNIDEKSTSTQNLNKLLHSENITKTRKISNGLTNLGKCRLLVTTDTYKTKLKILNSNKLEAEGLRNNFDQPYEKVHTKFLKFALGISKNASNNAIRAELGRFPLEIKLQQKLIKYWHRLEIMDPNKYPTLNEAYKVCKQQNHPWYANIENILLSNGLGHIMKNPTLFTESSVIQVTKTILEDQYIQKWDEKAKSSEKLQNLYRLKQKEYGLSSYLVDEHLSIDDRCLMTRIRTGCSKLNTHKYTDNKLCSLCGQTDETTQHLLLLCRDRNASQIRKKYMTDLQTSCPNLKHYNNEEKLACILNLAPIYPCKLVDDKFKTLCVNLVKDMLNCKNNTPL